MSQLNFFCGTIFLLHKLHQAGLSILSLLPCLGGTTIIAIVKRKDHIIAPILIVEHQR